MPERSSTTVPASQPSQSDAIRAADLIEREEALNDESRLLCEASYRRRLEIDQELCDIRRELERLGFSSKR